MLAKTSAAFIVIAALALHVSAHGYVDLVTIGTTTYTGYLPYTDPYYNPVPERIIRAIPGNGPVTDLSIIEQVLIPYHYRMLS